MNISYKAPCQSLDWILSSLYISFFNQGSHWSPKCLLPFCSMWMGGCWPIPNCCWNRTAHTAGASSADGNFHLPSAGFFLPDELPRRWERMYLLMRGLASWPVTNILPVTWSYRGLLSKSLQCFSSLQINPAHCFLTVSSSGGQGMRPLEIVAYQDCKNPSMSIKQCFKLPRCSVCRHKE